MIVQTGLDQTWFETTEIGLICCFYYFFDQVQLSVEDIEMILDTLIFDGKVEQSIVAGGDAGQTKLYRAVNPLIPPSGLMRMPCGSCPVSTCGTSHSVIQVVSRVNVVLHSFLTNCAVHVPGGIL